MTDLAYTQAKAEDIDIIFSQCRQLIESYEDMSCVDLPKVLSWMRRKIETQISSYTCVWENGCKVAYFHLSEDTDGTQLDDLYVLEAYRNRGIGTRILECCVEMAREPLYLYVFTGNLGAIRLYERFNFAVTRQVSPTRVIMTRCS